MPLPNAQFVGFQPEGLWPTGKGLFFNRNQAILAFGALVVTFTAAAVTNATVPEQAITVGVSNTTINDVAILVALGAPTPNVALMGTARVSPANTILARYINYTAGALTPPAAQVLLIVLFQVQ